MYPECDCKARHAATKAGEFVELPEFDGWAFLSAPLRRASPGAIYYGQSHDGEPFTFTVCPFCGLDLPMTNRERWKYTQADGEETE